MQTFVPYGANFYSNAVCLDDKRLVKQCVETSQILDAIQGRTKAWRTHPIVRMWTGYEPALALYGWRMCDEYNKRFDRIHACFDRFRLLALHNPFSYPVWLYSPSLQNSHRAALLHKDLAHYRQFFPVTEPKLNYVWYHPEKGLYYHGQLSKPKTVIWL